MHPPNPFIPFTDPQLCSSLCPSLSFDFASHLSPFAYFEPPSSLSSFPISSCSQFILQDFPSLLSPWSSYLFIFHTRYVTNLESAHGRGMLHSGKGKKTAFEGPKSRHFGALFRSTLPRRPTLSLPRRLLHAFGLYSDDPVVPNLPLYHRRILGLNPRRLSPCFLFLLKKKIHCN